MTNTEQADWVLRQWPDELAAGCKKITYFGGRGDAAGSWDYVTVDSDSRRVFLSHETQVDVINAESGKLLGTISDTPGIHGIAIAPKANRGFTSNGREDKVSMFDAESLRLIILRYQGGSGTVLDVVDAQNTLTTASNSYDDAQVRYRMALANLQTMTGSF